MFFKSAYLASDINDSESYFDQRFLFSGESCPFGKRFQRFNESTFHQIYLCGGIAVEFNLYFLINYLLQLLVIFFDSLSDFVDSSNIFETTKARNICENVASYNTYNINSNNINIFENGKNRFIQK